MNQTKTYTQSKSYHQTKQLCMAGVFSALVFIITRFLQIPIPLGYFNVGNSFILFFCLYLEAPYGIAVGAIGSALADLLSFPSYTIPTLLFKSLMPLLFYFIIGFHHEHKPERKKTMIAFSIATLIPLFGYTLTGALFAGNFYAGLAQFPGLLVEYVANIIIFFILQERFVFKK